MVSDRVGLQVSIHGIVQGVGFRPFVYNLAAKYNLFGWVKNTSGGVEIRIEGKPGQLESFLTALQDQAPPLSQIDSLSTKEIPPNGFEDFQIQHSQAAAEGFQPISPDVSVCDQCLEELLAPGDRRYRYPFINCTNCGPRFTIIKDIPYDRPQTTMAKFPMCGPCREEYENPQDRRFHAQPVACPDCGPQIWLEEKAKSGEGIFQTTAKQEQALERAQTLLADGRILAVKGLGGFHLACDAQNPEAVAALRNRKMRPDKPLAVMMPDLKTIQKHCDVSQAEESLLTSIKRPIVLLQKKSSSPLPALLAPGQTTLGVMLPYTPLHYLLFSEEDRYPEAAFSVLVMTSGNLSDNPILIDNQEISRKLGAAVDALLLHDRDIYLHCDDSVVRIPDPEYPCLSQPYPIRRSRGYAPYPLKLTLETAPILGVGAEQKSVFCLSKNRYAFLSQHIGDLKNFETLQVFEKSIRHFQALFRAAPERIAHDLHPDYLSTRYALDRCAAEEIPSTAVQHHHAHIASCLAENQHPAGHPVIGVAFDGTGLGTDGQIWGGEFLVADYQKFERVGQLRYTPLPGGDLAVREPWRMALSYLHSLDLGWDAAYTPVKHALTARDPHLKLRAIDLLRKQLASGLNAPDTSSMGRLFDAVSSLIGIRQLTSYEGQAAVELEAIADPDESAAYSFELSRAGIIDPAPLFQELIRDLRRGIPQARISARFHNGVAAMVLRVCQHIRQETGIDRVALSGGVWQNITLLTNTYQLLLQENFQVFIHQKVPANDGGIALGQVAIAQHLTAT